MKLKYFDLGLVDPEFIPSIWEYSNLIIPECPTLFSYTPNATAIKICGAERMDKKIKVENVPGHVKMIRMVSSAETSFIVSPDLMGFMFHYPDTDEYASLVRAIKAIVYKSLRPYSILLEEDGNDIYFLKDGLRKKFFGTMNDATSDGWRVAIFTITLSFNAELSNKIYKFEDEKFTEKGEILDISEIVGGLSEIVLIDRNAVTKEIIQKIAERYDLEAGKGSLSDDELSKMNDFASKYNDKEWVLNG